MGTLKRLPLAFYKDFPAAGGGEGAGKKYIERVWIVFGVAKLEVMVGETEDGTNEHERVLESLELGAKAIEELQLKALVKVGR
ncbi:hypothetical protein HDU93_007541 [Gonapodya sp. JEL0774]|nr:hypothetical protein HDU93_007541 [Gonapodya sp. JEL0774]